MTETTTEEATPGLRFVREDGERRLQQAWLIKSYDDGRLINIKKEWRDIEMVYLS